MARCEDFPCCGHEDGCCPDFDESGRQLNMRCTCGAVLPVNNRSSLCDGCLAMDDEGRPMDDEFMGETDEYDDGDNMTDVEADADTLASAGWGTNEDYGDYDGGSDFYDE